MENKNYSDYRIADIPEEDLNNISELEKSLSSKSNKDIVLIAYQQSNKVES
jgi:hypothetical protein